MPDAPSTILDLFHDYEARDRRATTAELGGSDSAVSMRRAADASRLKLVSAMLGVGNLERALAEALA